jgi:hypothetical protein
VPATMPVRASHHNSEPVNSKPLKDHI